MADVKGNVNITIGADVEAFKRAVDESKKKTKSFTDQLVEAAATTGAAFGTIKVAVLDSVKAFGEADRASKQLEQALIQQGIYSKDLAENYDKLATQTAELTGLDDDAVKATLARSQAYLGTIQITDELAKAAADLAAGLNIDLDEAFTKIAKSATGTTNLLKKQQIVVDETGNSHEKLAQILKQVESKFGGQAEASKNVLTSFGNLKTASGNLVESIGGQLEPAVRAIVDGLAKLAQTAADNKEFVKFITVVGGAAAGFIALGAAMSSLSSIVGIVTGLFAETTAVGAVLVGIAEAIGITVGALVGVFAAVVIAVGLLYAYWDKIWPAMQAVFHGFVNNIVDAAAGVGKVLAGALIGDLDLITEGLSQAKNAFKKGFQEIRDDINKRPEVKPLTPDEIAKLSHQQAILEANRKARLAEEAEANAHALRLKQIESNKVEILKLEVQGGSADLIGLKKQENAILEQEAATHNQKIIALLDEQLSSVRQKIEEQQADDAAKRQQFYIDDAAARQELIAAGNAAEVQLDDDKRKALMDAETTQKEAEQAVLTERIKNRQDTNKKFLEEQIKYGTAYATINKALNSDEVKGTEKASGELVALTQSKNATLKSIGKAASVAQIAIQTATAAMNIYAGFSTIPIIGVPLGIAGAAAAIAFGAERTADVIGAADGGLIKGGIPGRDSVPALLQQDELVVPDKSYEEVVNAVAAQRTGNGGGNEVTNGLLGQILEKLNVPTLNFNGDFISDDDYVNRMCAKIRDAVQFRDADLGV